MHEHRRESSTLWLSMVCRHGVLIVVSLGFRIWGFAGNLLPKKRQRPRMRAKIKVLINTVTAFRATHLTAFFVVAGSVL